MSYENARAYSKKILAGIVEEAKANYQKQESYKGKSIPRVIADLIDSSAYKPEIKEAFRTIFLDVLGAPEAPPVEQKLPENCIRYNGSFEPGMIVVPLTNPNCHDYMIGEPVLCLTDSNSTQAIDTNGRLGNHLPNSEVYPDACRLATNDEIDSFYERLAENSGRPVIFAA